MSHCVSPPPDEIQVPRRGRHRSPQYIDYYYCLCGARIALDVEQLRELMPAAFALIDIIGELPEAEWLPVQVLELAEAAVEAHEATHGREMSR